MTWHFRGERDELYCERLVLEQGSQVGTLTRNRLLTTSRAEASFISLLIPSSSADMSATPSLKAMLTTPSRRWDSVSTEFDEVSPGSLVSLTSGCSQAIQTALFQGRYFEESGCAWLS